ncbi:hypothetical protein J4T90_34185 (plasmid) [Sinorhizobium medicae]|uniref:hypothetical protein n=1 Tax=Sinorhizobium medicae TaxID=110321 RepID=UPI001AAE11B8|nr:hypothetical protein [Sinorhizobium medicae]MBO1944216.1 hypothetical protein [Sinorhizobium medicae]
MAALRQVAFYGKGGIGNSKRKPELVTASIEDRSAGSPSKNKMHFQSRMNVPASMRGGDGLPPSVRCRLHLEDGTTRGERKERTRLAATFQSVSEERPRLHMPRRVTTTHTTLFVTFVNFTTPIVPSTVWSISRSNHLKESN